MMQIKDTIISDGCFLRECKVEHSIVGERSPLDSGVELKDTLMMVEFQISGDNAIHLNPPVTSLSPANVDTSTLPEFLEDDDDELDDDFIKALATIHQSPSVGFDVDMTEILSSCCSPTADDSPGSFKDSLKRRRKQDSDAPSSP
ncbi:hypothetical protein BVRB_015360 [Beta vulgaris subsp. vulgaris]|uniref:Uncharacterized protein n=1 Tax=Beta vulgaris subsp. vulgaris TaxID=3555 RepID=A0A0J8B195_BETVV|nr:hypothetical protein BVRB_015360 [Beta vulgaris subsp. vulgaris]